MSKDIWAKLSSHDVWQDFYAYKAENGHLTRDEEADLKKYIHDREYLPVIAAIEAGGSFSVPEKKRIRKLYTSKKRVVYVYPREENYLFKLMTFLLVRQYDDIFSDSLYSFRVHSGVIKAIHRLMAVPELARKYTYKADISNYFNSIPVEAMLDKLKGVLAEEPRIYAVFDAILRDRRCMDGGRLLEEDKGVMAGTPFAVFLANVYLRELDLEMERRLPCYARYSDDILIMADTREELEAGVEGILARLGEARLTVNHEKEVYTAPRETWTFLGISYGNGTIDISPVSLAKLKAKLRRRARAIKRWQKRKGATNEQATRAFIRAINRKFFGPASSHELTWSRWYFPVINTDVTLHKLDACIQYWIRYLYSGRHNNANYRLRYEDMKALGYVSLVHAYYSR